MAKPTPKTTTPSVTYDPKGPRPVPTVTAPKIETVPLPKKGK